MFSCPCTNIYKNMERADSLVLRMRLLGHSERRRTCCGEKGCCGTLSTHVYRSSSDVTEEYTGSEYSLRCTRFP